MVFEESSLKVVPDITLKQLNSKQQAELVQTLHAWRIQPNGTFGRIFARLFFRLRFGCASR
jgi:predicted flavoprotein YhiN